LNSTSEPIFALVFLGASGIGLPACAYLDPATDFNDK
jgi:hypothetical protein